MRVNSTDFQNAVGKYLALAQKETIIITKNGKSVAKLKAFTDPQEYLINEVKGDYNVKRFITYEEYQEIVASSAYRYELINGEIYLLASPSFQHQVLVRKLTLKLDAFLQTGSCQVVPAPFDVRLFGHATKFSEDPNVVQPDLVVICDLENITETGQYEGIPKLVVEVLSLSTRGKDLITKLELYMRSGIGEYWIVDPEEKQVSQYEFDEDRELAVHRILQQDEVLNSLKFPGFKLALQEIFSNQTN